MIPYEELDRALARWKARTHGGAVSDSSGSIEIGSGATVVAVAVSVAAVDYEVEGLPPPTEQTGETDLGAPVVRSYEEDKNSTREDARPSRAPGWGDQSPGLALWVIPELAGHGLVALVERLAVVGELAAADLVAASQAHLGEPIGIGEALARRRDDVGVAARERRLRERE